MSKKTVSKAAPAAGHLWPSDRLALISIRFVEVRAKTQARIDSPIPEDVGFGFRFGKPKTSASDRHVTSECPYQAVVSDRSKKQPFASVRAVAEVAYAWKGNSEELTEEIRNFVSAHACFSAWPYWREIVSSAFARMSLPPVIVPMITYGQIVETLKANVEVPDTDSSD